MKLSLQNTPSKVLTELSKSNFYEYRVAVVLNPNTPETIIEILEQDKDIHVSQAIKKRSILFKKV